MNGLYIYEISFIYKPLITKYMFLVILDKPTVSTRMQNDCYKFLFKSKMNTHSKKKLISHT